MTESEFTDEEREIADEIDALLRKIRKDFVEGVAWCSSFITLDENSDSSSIDPDFSNTELQQFVSKAFSLGEQSQNQDGDENNVEMALIPLSYKRDAVNYWRSPLKSSSKKLRSFSSVQSRFKLLKR